MTQQQFDRGTQIVSLIREYEKQIKSLQSLITRIEETTDKNQENIEIQIAEGYAYTPQAQVNITNLNSFLITEIHRIQLIIKELEREFEQL
jgi:hypothetical protein